MPYLLPIIFSVQHSHNQTLSTFWTLHPEGSFPVLQSKQPLPPPSLHPALSLPGGLFPQLPAAPAALSSTSQPKQSCFSSCSHSLACHHPGLLCTHTRGQSEFVSFLFTVCACPGGEQELGVLFFPV